MPGEPISLFSLGIASLVFIERAFDRWMQWKRKSPNLIHSERGALGNGTKALAQRFDHIDNELAVAKTSRDKLWEKVSEVSERISTVEGRLE